MVRTAVFGASLALAAPTWSKDTLYQELGGYDGIAAFTDTFLMKAQADARLGRFFKGHNASTSRVLRQHLIEFLCEKTGGPCFYTGLPMKEAHTGLNITDKDWEAAAAIMAQTMTDLKVGKEVQEQVGLFVTSLKPDIVGM
jgi:hemoglobin